MASKTQRHAAILETVRHHRVSSQEVLRELLAKRGYDVAQGTLSRDIRELGLVKVRDPHGPPSYQVPPDLVDPTPTLARLLPSLYVDSDGVDNLLIVRTLTGGAQPVAVAIDHAEWDEVVGTIAGDDTILIVLRKASMRPGIVRRIEQIAGVQ